MKTLKMFMLIHKHWNRTLMAEAIPNSRDKKANASEEKVHVKDGKPAHNFKLKQPREKALVVVTDFQSLFDINCR